MKMQTRLPRQPHPSEIQALQQLFQSGLLAQAEARAQTMLVNYPNALALYNILGLCQQSQGKFREAVASFRKMLSIDPRIAELHFNLGVLHSQLDETDEAIACYRKALQLKPNFTVAHFNLATLLQAQGLLQEAAIH